MHLPTDHIRAAAHSADPTVTVLACDLYADGSGLSVLMEHCGKTLIARWNDRPRRTRDEVIAILERAIKQDVPHAYRDSSGRLYVAEAT